MQYVAIYDITVIWNRDLSNEMISCCGASGESYSRSTLLLLAHRGVKHHFSLS